MKAVVFAYHNMGVAGITKLVDAGFEISLVFTHADDTAEHIWFESVACLCRQLAIEYVTPDNPNTPAWIKRIGEEGPDIIFSFYYRALLSKEILAIPPLGAYNLHGSYLPAYRGRCPVNWVIINGENYSGVTLHQMVEKPDAGPIVAQKKVEVAFDDTALTLFNKLVQAAGAMLDDVLPKVMLKEIPKSPQDLGQGSYYGGRKPEDGRILWERSAREIYNLIRGVTRPYPGAFCFLEKTRMIIWRALVYEDVLFPPAQITVRGKGVLIGTKRGSLEPVEVEIQERILKGNDLFIFFKQHAGEFLQ